ncbi:non-hydrolyzing UDP-N-acetylglucosamine 2-epimerase [Thermodesulfobacteriota bacterium]
MVESKLKILMIVGARPQFIKAGMICKAIKHVKSEEDIKISQKILHTGQHYDENMSKVFFQELGIPFPDFNLGIHDLSNSAMIGRMIEKIEEVLIKERPDWVLVFGDTNSTIAGSIAAKSMKLKVAHVEAGLRSFNIKMIEEQNRIVTDRLSDLLFCPTEIAVDNLEREGIPNKKYGQKVVNVGDVMYDSLIFYSEVLNEKEVILLKLGVEKNNYILATIHRAENTDKKERLDNIISALNEIGSDKKVVLPLHPRTKKILEKRDISRNNICFIPPISYLEMLFLEKNCRVIVTDSGGVQKEAYFFKKPCVTIRDETEWVELVKAGVNLLVKADKEEIKRAIETSYDVSFSIYDNFYGDGGASKKVIENIMLF